MYNSDATGAYGSGYPTQPQATMLPSDEQYPDSDNTYTGGLASQDVSAQHYQVNLPDDDPLTYGDATVLPPRAQYSDRDNTYSGGLASQDSNAQHYQVHLPDDDQLTYGEGRTFQHSTSFADYPPHTLPHPASDQAAASVMASGVQTTIQLPRVHFPDDGPDGMAHTNGAGWHDEPLTPVTTVYGQPPTLARQQTFGPVTGVHHVSAAEAFPAAAGVADRTAGQTMSRDTGGSVPTPAFTPLNLAGPGKRKLPWAGQFFQNTNWIMTSVVLAWIVVTIGYIIVRASVSLKNLHGADIVYGIYVLVIEALGATTLFLYGTHLMVRHRKFDPPFVRKPFSVRVVVPTYKEDIETLEETVECAIKAAQEAMKKGQANAVHIYLCDDAPKDHKEVHKGESFLASDLRQKLTEQLYKIHGIPVIRVGRDKGKNESNPKSANLNSCLKKIYGENATPPEMEVVAVFDADQAAHSNFFTATLPWMDAGDDVAVVQSPQVFRGVHWTDDVFNHENVGFWHYLQPAYNIIGFISCAGTNFVIRSSAFAEAGYFPTHTLTEDYALGMEMRRKGWRGMFVEEELVRGTAPDKVRAAFGQRSRWCKGPYQMLFSRKSPLFAPGLSLWYRILYMSPCYIYVVSALATPTFTLIPVIYIWGEKFPAGNLTPTVLGWLIAYTVMSSLIKFYVRPGRNVIHDLRAHWNAEVSTKNFWWMYAKAAVRGTMAACGCSNLGWTPGAGGAKKSGFRIKLRQASQDLLFIFLFALLLTVTIVYGFLMVAAGAQFVGPLGLSILWTMYHALAPWLLLYYSILPFQHEIPTHKCWFMTGRVLFNSLCNVAFVLSFGLLIASVVFAFLAGEQSFLTQAARQKSSIPPSNKVYWLNVPTVFKNL
ncbi:hypothetical protein ABBQ38_001719 [Trebouxia sp. C0009 RCD-2024]